MSQSYLHRSRVVWDHAHKLMEVCLAKQIEALAWPWAETKHPRPGKGASAPAPSGSNKLAPAVPPSINV